MYAIQDIPGKGKGLIAIEKILKGTRILCEEPVIILPQGKGNNESLWTLVGQQIDSLSEPQRQAILSMRNMYPYKNSAEQFLGIF